MPFKPRGQVRGKRHHDQRLSSQTLLLNLFGGIKQTLANSLNMLYNKAEGEYGRRKNSRNF